MNADETAAARGVATQVREEEPAQELGAAASPAPGSWWSALRPLVLRLHFYAGVLIAPFLVVAATTGLLYVYTPQLEQALYQRELHVADSGPQLPLAQQVRAARAVVPGREPSLVWPAPTPTDTTRVIFDTPRESFFRTVFVDPHSGEVRGDLETYGSSQALPVRTWIDQLHRNLLLGDPGRIYSEIAASWLWVVALGGVLLWVARNRKGRRVRGILAPKPGASGRQRTLSWHGAIGIWAAVGFLFMSATGLTWSTFAGENVSEFRAAVASETPEVSTSPTPGGGTGDVGIDRILSAARQNDVTGAVEITLPDEPGAAYSVMQTRRLWPVEQDQVAVEAATGEVTEVVRFEDYPVLAKLARWGIDAHMGVLFGVANQIALTVVVVALLALIVLGYRMWWRRRPTREFGPLPPRGAWRRVPGKVLAPVILATALVGFLLPMLGLSLLVFLALDLVLARRARTRRVEVSS